MLIRFLAICQLFRAILCHHFWCLEYVDPQIVLLKSMGLLSEWSTTQPEQGQQKQDHSSVPKNTKTSVTNVCLQKLPFLWTTEIRWGWTPTLSFLVKQAKMEVNSPFCFTSNEGFFFFFAHLLNISLSFKE